MNGGIANTTIGNSNSVVDQVVREERADNWENRGCEYNLGRLEERENDIPCTGHTLLDEGDQGASPDDDKEEDDVEWNI